MGKGSRRWRRSSKACSRSWSDALVLGDPSSLVHNVLPRVPRWQGGALVASSVSSTAMGNLVRGQSQTQPERVPQKEPAIIWRSASSSRRCHLVNPRSDTYTSRMPWSRRRVADKLRPSPAVGGRSSSSTMFDQPFVAIASRWWQELLAWFWLRSV